MTAFPIGMSVSPFASSGGQEAVRKSRMRSLAAIVAPSILLVPQVAATDSELSGAPEPRRPGLG
jgi:hypothetical protein